MCTCTCVHMHMCKLLTHMIKNIALLRVVLYTCRRLFGCEKVRQTNSRWNIDSLLRSIILECLYTDSPSGQRCVPPRCNVIKVRFRVVNR